jgi:hypothetical protein
MRSHLFIAVAVALLASPAMAQSSNPPKVPKQTPSGKTPPVKGASSASSCAAYGPGFVKLEGSDTCVHIGGSISVEAGGALGGRR